MQLCERCERGHQARSRAIEAIARPTLTVHGEIGGTRDACRMLDALCRHVDWH
jgi:hypothetical protein